MKCDKCKKDYEEGVEAAYKLGLMAGEEKSQETMKLLARTNRQIFEEFQRIDEINPNPFDPDVVHIPIKDVAGLLQNRKKARMRCHYLNRIGEIAKAQVGDLIELITS